MPIKKYANKLEQEKAWRKKNAKRVSANNRRTHLQRTYGLTVEAFESLSRGQKHRCAICNKKTKLVVDHDHKTGKIRGLLCIQCNTSLGTFGDTIDGVKKVLTYLQCC